MNADPRKTRGPFARLVEELRKCKKKRTCPRLHSRGYYFEPNPLTALKWTKEGLYGGDLDCRLLFVGESPGPQAIKNRPAVTRCWSTTWQDGRFREFREKYGYENCYITNSVKCGVRLGTRHLDSEVMSCRSFLLREIELIDPLVVVALGWNSYSTLRKFVWPLLQYPPVLFFMTHYSGRGDVWPRWDREARELKFLLCRLGATGK